MNDVRIALIICTYHRKEFVDANIAQLLASNFFDHEDKKYFSRLYIYVVDNGFDFEPQNGPYLYIVRNSKNTGGSGGFQRGLEEVRRSDVKFTHVIFMDDDVRFETESFYILYDYLLQIAVSDWDRPVAGRMLCMDKPNIQYTAAEIWNGGKIKHIEHMRDLSVFPFERGKVERDSGADYGGWWFCCYPMSFTESNDIMPFFLHCDDVEYGLRCGKSPIIIEGVHVWHETYEKRISPLMLYYDTRNPLFVNQIHGTGASPEFIFAEWKITISKYHAMKDWISEYYVISAMNDFLKGVSWLKKIDSAKRHKYLQKIKSNRYKNAIFWRIVARRFRKYVLRSA
ncbi:MAG: glycosyltransferase family 2 protein [Clostridium sp.]|nr:glycosyltransferase family 2 protein [Clostridium sp.]